MQKNQSFECWLEQEAESWKDFRRALRTEQRPAFDRLFARARTHASGATQVGRSIPFDALVMAVMLDQELELERLATEVASLRLGRA